MELSSRHHDPTFGREENEGHRIQAASGLPADELWAITQEVFDSGVYAALELCRQSRLSGRPYNPFEAFEQRAILLALRSTGGNQLRAAEVLGINRSTLRKRMKKHGIHVQPRVGPGR